MAETVNDARQIAFHARAIVMVAATAALFPAPIQAQAMNLTLEYAGELLTEVLDILDIIESRA